MEMMHPPVAGQIMGEVVMAWFATLTKTIAIFVQLLRPILVKGMQDLQHPNKT
jgi:hypothetical protein